MHSAIRLKKTRTTKKNNNKQPWLELVKTPQYQVGLKERYKIERKFGEAKQGHGLGSCRYLGSLGFAVNQSLIAGTAKARKVKGIVNPSDQLAGSLAPTNIPIPTLIYKENHIVRPEPKKWYQDTSRKGLSLICPIEATYA